MSTLTRADIMALSAGRAIDTLVARHVIRATIDGNRSSIDPDAPDTWIETPRYSTDAAAVYEAEAELERRGLAGRYADCLADMLINDNYEWQLGRIYEEELFVIRHASPLDCCKAMLLATMEAK